MVDKVSKLAQVAALRIARATEQSSRGTRESRPRVPKPGDAQQAVATSGVGVASDPRETTPPSDAARPATPRKPKRPPPGASAAASGAKRKRAPAGTFDRKAYQRELMRKRRQEAKKAEV